MRLVIKQQGHGNRHERREGFTIAELLVASVATGMVFVAVYSIFVQAIGAEATTTLRWQGRCAAESIVSHIAETLAQAVNIPETAAIQGGTNGSDGESFLKCTVGGRALAGGNVSGMSVSRVRYSWNFQDVNQDSESISLQKIQYAGTKIITPIAGADQMGEDELWASLPPITIGTHLSGISILYKNAEDPEASWQDSWNGPAENVAIRIRVNVDNQIAEKIVIPQTNSPIVAE